MSLAFAASSSHVSAICPLVFSKIQSERAVGHFGPKEIGQMLFLTSSSRSFLGLITILFFFKVLCSCINIFMKNQRTEDTKYMNICKYAVCAFTYPLDTVPGQVNKYRGWRHVFIKTNQWIQRVEDNFLGMSGS